MSQHRIELKLGILFTEKWRSGSGEGSMIVDRLIQWDPRGLPYIPGSTLKGVIRESCEKISRSLDFPEPADPHDASRRGPGSFGPLAGALSPVDRLFGNKYEEGGLFFRDARLVKEISAPSFLQSRTRRNRKLGTVRDHHLFTSQYAMPARLATTISGFHRELASLEEADPPYAYALLIAAIRLVERIGGDKSVGRGGMRDGIEIESIVYNNQSLPVNDYLAETLPQYLNGADYKEMRS